MLFAARASHADVFVEQRGTYKSATTTTELFKIEIPDAHREYGISVTAILDAGSGSLRILDPSGEMVYQHLWSTRQSQERARLPVTRAGTYTIEVSIENARGEWRARIVTLPSRASLKWMYLSAALLIALPLFIVILAHLRGAAIKYAATGALMFLLGYLVWLIGAIVLEITARYALEDAMPYRAFLWTQSILLGLWQGLAAIAGVLVVAFVARAVREKPANAVAAGIGAGAFEMFVTGVISFLGLAVMFGDGAKSDKAQFNQAYDMAVTPLLPLAEPAILAVQTVCFVAATLLIVFGLRVRRAGPVFGGGAIFAGVLTAVSASRTITLFGPESRWVIMAVLVPIAALSCVLIRRNLPAWIESPKTGETALDAFVRQNENSSD